MGRLKDKVIIVTGGAGGMGATHSRKFVEEGAKVVITDLNENVGTELAKELGDNAIFIKHDVTKYDDWNKVVSETEDKFGPVTGLINIEVNENGTRHPRNSEIIGCLVLIFIAASRALLSKGGASVRREMADLPLVTYSI